MRVVLIGAGRLATNLAQALRQAGHHILSVYSRTMASAQSLAQLVDSQPTDQLSALPAQADIFIIAVKDSALASVIQEVVQGREDQLFVHTAGSMTMSLFTPYTQHHGVFYPMQTFSKERLVDFQEIPVFLEASDEQSLLVMKTLAASISQCVYQLSSDERKYLHLSAVFACNFVNHCYALAGEILEEHGLPFSVMLPLIDETARKAHQLSPREAQTGPAVRNDENVMSQQSLLLSHHPDMQEIYKLLSHSIHRLSVKS